MDAPQTRPEVESIAIELAKRIERSGVRGNRGSTGPRVLVMPFLFGSEVNAMLDRGPHRYELADRQCAAEIIKELKMPAQEYLHYAVASWLGRKCAAHLVVMGAAQLKKGELRLELLVVRAKDGKQVAKISEKMPWTEEDAKATQLNASPSPDSSIPERTEGIYRAGKDGINVPECRSCPNPQFTDEAANARNYSTTVRLRVVVTVEGEVTQIHLVQGSAFGLNERAIEQVSKWKLKPARNAQGTPVPVWTLVEVMFRVY